MRREWLVGGLALVGVGLVVGVSVLSWIEERRSPTTRPWEDEPSPDPFQWYDL